MISQRSQGLYSIFSLIQIVICFAGFWVHLVAINWFLPLILEGGNYIVYSVLIAVGLGVEASLRYESANDWYRKKAWRKHALALRQCVFAACPVLFYLAATKDPVISRTFLFSYLVVLYFILVLTSSSLPRLLSSALFGRRHLERTLLIGSIAKASRLMGWLELKADLGFETIGLLSDDVNARYSSLPVLGGTADVERIVKSHDVTQVILAEFPLSTEYLTLLTEKCEALGVRFLVRSDLE